MTTAYDPIASLVQAGAGKTLCQFGPSEIVYSQGDPAEEIFYTLQGRVKVTSVSDTGKQAVLAFLGRGEFLGHNILTGVTQRTSTITTITDCLLMRLERTAMERALESDSKFCAFFIAFLLRRNLRMQADVADHLFNSGEKRLARALLLLADFAQDDSSELLLPHISQETLAEMIGTTRSRVSFFMNKFRRLGHLSYEGNRVRLRRSLSEALSILVK